MFVNRTVVDNGHMYTQMRISQRELNLLVKHMATSTIGTASVVLLDGFHHLSLVVEGNAQHEARRTYHGEKSVTMEQIRQQVSDASARRQASNRLVRRRSSVAE